MPEFDTGELLKCIKELVKIDKDWIPKYSPDTNAQLYCRLSHISTDGALGVKTPAKTKLYCIMSPSILKNNAIRVKCSHDVYKNWPLGHGEYRISGNIGPLVPIVHNAK